MRRLVLAAVCLLVAAAVVVGPERFTGPLPPPAPPTVILVPGTPPPPRAANPAPGLSAAECSWVIDTLALDHGLDAAAAEAAHFALVSGVPDQLGQSGAGAVTDWQTWLKYAGQWAQARDLAARRCGRPAQPSSATVAQALTWFASARATHLQWLPLDPGHADWHRQWAATYERLSQDFSRMGP